VIFSNTGFIQEQFSRAFGDCFRCRNMTGHPDIKVDIRGPINPGSEEMGIIRDT
jgi:hypothetical protein